VSATELEQAVTDVLIDRDVLQRRIEELGEEISADYAGRDLLLICALLTKPERREAEVPVRYVGFEIPNRFVIGYGLDFAERYRNLPYVGVLDPALIPGGH
jgi:hypoxanthine phosphoribosyltransferase